MRKAVREHDLEPVDRPKLEIVEETDGRPTRVQGDRRRPAARSTPGTPTRASRSTRPPIDRHRRRTSSAASSARQGACDPRAGRAGRAARRYRHARLRGQDRRRRRSTAAARTGQMHRTRRGTLHPRLRAGIAGMKAGRSQRRSKLAFPTTTPPRSLAGKAAIFTVDAARRQGTRAAAASTTSSPKPLLTNQTLDELRADLRGRLEAIAPARARRAIGNAVMEKLLRGARFSAAARAGRARDRPSRSRTRSQPRRRDRFEST